VYVNGSSITIRLKCCVFFWKCCKSPGKQMLVAGGNPPMSVFPFPDMIVGSIGSKSRFWPISFFHSVISHNSSNRNHVGGANSNSLFLNAAKISSGANHFEFINSLPSWLCTCSSSLSVIMFR